MNIREELLEELEVLSQPSKQLDYERSLTLAGHAPSELISGFCDDLYRPKDARFIDAFSSDELKELGHLYGLIAEASMATFATVADMLKDPKWRRVVAFAKDVMAQFKSTGAQTRGSSTRRSKNGELELRVVYEDLPDMIELEAQVHYEEWSARSRAYASPDFLTSGAERLVMWARSPQDTFRLDAGADTGIGWLVLDFYIIDRAGHARCNVVLATDVADPKNARPAEAWRFSIEMTTELGLIERFGQECLSLHRDHSGAARLLGLPH